MASLLKKLHSPTDSWPLLEREPESYLSERVEARLATGFDLTLFFLFAHGVITLLWGIALGIFALGVVPIAWALSQYGQTHPGVTNVVITLVSTLSTTHLKYTVQKAAEEYTAARLNEGFTFGLWKILHGLATVQTLPPFAPRRRTWWYILPCQAAWMLAAGGIVAHSSCIVAILQPEPFFDHKLYNDTVPCAIPQSDLSFELQMQSDALTELDQAVVSMGFQLASFHDQVAGNTTTSIVGRVFVKDKFGYSAVGGLSDGLQEVPGVEFDLQCGDDKTSSPSLASLWSAMGIPLPTARAGNNTVNFITPLKSNTSLQIVTSGPLNSEFAFPSTSSAMFSVIQLNGNGALLTVDQTGSTTGCVWTVIPRLVHLQMVNFTTSAIPSLTQTSDSYPAPVGRTVLKAVTGMAQATAILNATLAWRTLDSLISVPYFFNDTSPSTETILALLLGDSAKAGFTAYSNYFKLHGPLPQTCYSNNRTVQMHWQFGNVNGLGVIAVLVNVGVGLGALWVVQALALGHSRVGMQKRARVKGVEPLQVVDAFRLGRAADINTDGWRMVVGREPVMRLWEGRIVARL